MIPVEAIQKLIEHMNGVIKKVNDHRDSMIQKEPRFFAHGYVGGIERMQRELQEVIAQYAPGTQIRSEEDDT